MNHNDERALHDADHAAWIAYVAPGMAVSLMTLSDAKVSEYWQRMTRAYQTAVWSHLSEADRERVTAARKSFPVEQRRAA